MVSSDFVVESNICDEFNRKFVFCVMDHRIVVPGKSVFQVICASCIECAIVAFQDIDVPHIQYFKVNEE